MPKVNWGSSGIAAIVDGFDRDSQYKEYTGKIPPLNLFYLWRIKVMKFAAATSEKSAQLRVGLELIPRDRDEKQYEGYFVMAFLNISDNERAAPFWVPFLDVLGITGRQLQEQTFADDDGNVTRIGKYKHTGETEILAKIEMDYDRQGKERINVKRYASADGVEIEEDTDDEDYDSEVYDDSYADEDGDEDW